MNLLFLRGKVDCRTQKVKKLEEHHDMYTQLAFAMCGPEDRAMMMYYGGKRRFIEYDWNHYERWEPDFKGCSINVPFHNRDGFADFIPSVVLCRGGFPEYDNLVDRLPRSVVKVYYGAGKRFIPKENKYDLILVDCDEQVRKVNKKYTKAFCAKFFKPAADNIFYPREVEKKYDICFVAANPKDKRKRVSWVHKTCPRDLRVLQLGMETVPAPKNFKVKHVPREKMPYYMSQCRLGIVPYTKDDSGPRVIPEFMACGVPPKILNTVRFWREKYIGEMKFIKQKESLWRDIKETLNGERLVYGAFCREYYSAICSLIPAAKHLRTLIEKARINKEL